jgi:hypothetical protein
MDPAKLQKLNKRMSVSGSRPAASDRCGTRLHVIAYRILVENWPLFCRFVDALTLRFLEIPPLPPPFFITSNETWTRNHRSDIVYKYMYRALLGLSRPSKTSYIRLH